MTQPKEGQLPYGTYGMLKSTVERFVDATVPTSLNRHVLHDLSGGDFSALSTTLRFLGLMKEDRSPTQAFRDLVAAKKQSDTEYESKLLDVLGNAYDKIIGKVNIEEGTLPEIEKAFKDAGAPQGQMLTKTVRFYVKALEDCGVPVSEHITKPRPGKPRQKTEKGKKKKKDAGDEGGDGNGKPPKDDVPQGVERLAMPGDQNAFIQYPSKLTAKHFKMFEAMLAVLKTYVSLDETEEDKKP